MNAIIKITLILGIAVLLPLAATEAMQCIITPEHRPRLPIHTMRKPFELHRSSNVGSDRARAAALLLILARSLKS